MLDTATRDFHAWARSPRAVRQLDKWAHRYPALGGWTVAALASPRSSATTDAMQAALVALAQSGEAVAVTVLLTQLRPGLVGVIGWARSVDPGLASPSEAADEVLACFAETLMTHRLDRRPRKIAANLLLDTRQKIWRSSRRSSPAVSGLRSSPPPATPSPVPATGPAASTGGDGESLSARPSGKANHRGDPELAVDELDLVTTVAAAIDGLARDDRSRRVTAEVAYRAWILDETRDDIAADVGLRPDAVRARLSRLRTQVRQTRSSGVPGPPTPVAGYP